MTCKLAIIAKSLKQIVNFRAKSSFLKTVVGRTL